MNNNNNNNKRTKRQISVYLQNAYTSSFSLDTY